MREKQIHKIRSMAMEQKQIKRKTSMSDTGRIIREMAWDLIA